MEYETQQTSNKMQSVISFRNQFQHHIIITLTSTGHMSYDLKYLMTGYKFETALSYNVTIFINNHYLNSSISY